ncbi:MAG: dihydropteroate synthase [Acidimicrobiia bacterium]|nr:dihydropteroate synthase [Acidimicrobiia bacterium]
MVLAAATWAGAASSLAVGRWAWCLPLGGLVVVRVGWARSWRAAARGRGGGPLGQPAPVHQLVVVSTLAGAAFLFAAGSGQAAWAGLDDELPGTVEGRAVLSGDPRPVAGGVRVEVRMDGRRWDALASGSAAGVLRPMLVGEVVELTGRTTPRRHGDRWQASRHVVGTVSVAEVRRTDEAGVPPVRVANAIHRALAHGSARLDPTARGLLAGLVVGDTRSLPPDVDHQMRVAGLSHLTAVSGQNVAFVLTVFAPLLRRLRLRPRAVATLAVLAWFALLTRFEPSVLRATVMAALAVDTSGGGRRFTTIGRLAAAVTILVLVDPFLVWTYPFQLSVAATTGIALWARPLAERLPGPDVLRQPVALTVTAQAGVAPVLVTLFDEMPLVAIPANVAVSQMAGWLMIWGLTAGVLAGAVLGGLGDVVGLTTVVDVVQVPTTVLSSAIAAVGAWGARAPIGSLGPPEVAALALLGGGLAAVRALVRRRGGPRARVRNLVAGAVAGALAAGVVVHAGVTLPPLMPGQHEPARGVVVLVPEEPTEVTVLVLDGRVAPDAPLDALRDLGVRAAPVVVARSWGSRVTAAVAALRSRFPELVVVRPDTSVTAAAPDGSPFGGSVGGGRLVVEVDGDHRPGTAPTALASPLHLWVGATEVVVSAAPERLEVEIRPPPLTEPAGMGIGESARVASPSMELALGDHRFDVTHRAVVMGILNRTPDSFYDRGAYWDFDAFLAKADQLVADGADFLDVGGVKAGPGEEVTEAEELERVVPAVEALRARFDLPLSVDTWRASVAAACFEAGAVVGNDISGFADPAYLGVCAAAGASVVATHIRLAPRVPDPDPRYDDVVRDVRDQLADRAARARAAGIEPERIMVDAGLDLGKTEAQSLELLRASDQLASLGYPVFLSASNKRFLWHLLDVDVDSATAGTSAAHALGIALGCRVLRAHDCRAARRVADVMAAVVARR